MFSFTGILGCKELTLFMDVVFLGKLLLPDGHFRTITMATT